MFLLNARRYWQAETAFCAGVLVCCVLGLAATGCKRAITFVPPESEGNADASLSALRSVGDEYKNFETVSARSRIEAREISISVINNLKTLGHTAGGSFYFDHLSDDARSQFTSRITHATTDYLSKKCKVVDQARLKLLIMLYDEDSIHFDGNGYPWASVGIKLFLLDTKTQQIVWFTDNADVRANDPLQASDRASVSIDNKLDRLFGVANGSVLDHK